MDGKQIVNIFYHAAGEILLTVRYSEIGNKGSKKIYTKG